MSALLRRYSSLTLRRHPSWVSVDSSNADPDAASANARANEDNYHSSSKTCRGGSRKDHSNDGHVDLNNVSNSVPKSQVALGATPTTTQEISTSPNVSAGEGNGNEYNATLEDDDQDNDADVLTQNHSKTEDLKDATSTSHMMASLGYDGDNKTTVNTKGEWCLICMESFDDNEGKPAMHIPCQAKCNQAPVHKRCIYEWAESNTGTKESTCPLCRGTMDAVDYCPTDVLGLPNLVQFCFRRAFVLRPLPAEAGMVRCYVRTHRNGFELWLQKPSGLPFPRGRLPQASGPATGDVRLLIAKRSSTTPLSSRVDIALGEGIATSSSAQRANHIASVRSTCLGLEHTVVAPHTGNFFSSGGNGERELAAVTFGQNRLGRGIGPRKMQICIPRITSETADCIPLHQPLCKEETMVAKLKILEEDAQFFKWKNKAPEWSEAIGAFCLDFSGRVLIASNKNFIVQNKLQFGKVAPNLYTMDCAWPLSLTQAFGVCVAACERKWACA